MLLWQSVYKISSAAVTVLLKFLALFIYIVGGLYANTSLQKLSKGIPADTNAAQRFLWSGCKQQFVTYVVCPTCDELYSYDQCIRYNGPRTESVRCKNVLYPDHPFASKRKDCGACLLKTVHCGRKSKLVPVKEYSYQPLRVSLGRLLSREGFVDQCEMWRQRESTVPQGYYGDIYDGRIWHEFTSQMPHGSSVLSSPYCYLLTLNVDWFQPFLRTTYSLGAIYLTIQNLPRHLRYKEENVMLVGVIPGPFEPKLTVNSYLSPLVEELKQSWEEGLSLTTFSGTAVTVRALLSCVSCDIPASRKVCGFLGHNARLGCNKCLKPFQTNALGRMNYSGYDRSTWPPRSVEKHRSDVRLTLSENTKTKQRAKEAELGCRYSVLLQLPYFDPVRFTPIDLMHNLYLGTGKHLFKLWVSLGLLGKTELEKVEKQLKLFVVPNSVGRLPSNIASNYGGFKAAQWRSWITIYSPVVLKSLLPADHLRCWLLFVRACSILSHRVVTNSDIQTADSFLHAFCKKFEQLYGEDNCTPNLHLHLHLKDCLFDFGPPHSFWCFSFERYNGLLGSYHTNQKNIEVQIMRKFINSQLLHSTKHNLPVEYRSLLPGRNGYSGDPTSITETADDLTCLSMLTMSSTPLPNPSLSFELNQNVSLLPPSRQRVFSSATVKQLEELYKQLFPNRKIISVSPFHLLSGRSLLCGEVIGSSLNATSCKSSSVITAYWPVRDGPISSLDPSRVRIGCVQYYAKHSVSYATDNSGVVKCQYVCAFVRWMRQHPQESWFGASAIVCYDEFENMCMYSYIPVQRICAIAAHFKTKLNLSGFDEHVFVAVPVPLRLCF